MVLVTWQLQRKSKQREKKQGGGPRYLAGWQGCTETHQLDEGMGEGVGEEDEWGQIDRERREKLEGAPERGVGGRSNILASHISYLTWLPFPCSTSCDSLGFSAQKKPELGSASPFRWMEVRTDIAQSHWRIINGWVASKTAQQWCGITTTQPNQGCVFFFLVLQTIFQTPAWYYLIPQKSKPHQ